MPKTRKPYIDQEAMSFKEIGKQLGMPTMTVVQVYQRAVSKLRLRYSSPARRAMLTELLADLPEGPGYVGNARRPVQASELPLGKFPLIPKRRTRP
jgi:hypothetical protein